MTRVAILVGVVLLLLWGITLLRATWQEVRAERQFPPSGDFIRVGETAVHYVDMGAGPDLVLIHGASGNLRDMTFSLLPRLAERYRVIAFDRPGLGYTDRINDTGATLAQQAGLLMQAARQLGADRPIVVGQSYGGAVALAWASEFPDRVAALVPVSAVSNPWTTPLDPFYRVTSSHFGKALVVPALTAYVSGARIRQAIDSVFPPQSPPVGYDDFIGAPLTLRRISLRANAVQRANLLDEIKLQLPKYDQITAPTEIVHGTADTTVGLSIHSEKLVRQIDGAILTRLEGIGHMPHHAAEDDVVAAIDRAAERAGLR